MKTTKELLAESRALRFSFTKPAAEDYIEQVFNPMGWTYYFGQVLGAVGTDLVWHVYFPDIDSIWKLHTNVVPDGMTVIIHGHSRDEHCATKTLCHVLGYKPDGDEFTEIQLKNWRKFGYD